MSSRLTLFLISRRRVDHLHHAIMGKKNSGEGSGGHRTQLTTPFAAAPRPGGKWSDRVNLPGRLSRSSALEAVALHDRRAPHLMCSSRTVAVGMASRRCGAPRPMGPRGPRSRDSGPASRALASRAVAVGLERSRSSRRWAWRRAGRARRPRPVFPGSPAAPTQCAHQLAALIGVGGVAVGGPGAPRGGGSMGSGATKGDG